jgi:hypothetical protein
MSVLLWPSPSTAEDEPRTTEAALPPLLTVPAICGTVVAVSFAMSVVDTLNRLSAGGPKFDLGESVSFEGLVNAVIDTGTTHVPSAGWCSSRATASCSFRTSSNV